MRGYAGIGIWNWKHDCNIGTLFRSAWNFNMNLLFTIGRPYKRQASDTCHAILSIPYFNYLTFEDFYKNIPVGCRLIAIENSKNARPLSGFCHPDRAFYLLGSEGQSLPDKILEKCWATVIIDTKSCLNVSVAGSIVMYDRMVKNASNT